MSGDNQDRAIRIKLEVIIPPGATAPIIETSGPTELGKHPDPKAFASVNNCGVECILPGSPRRARVFAVGVAPRDTLCGFPRRAHGVVTVGASEVPGDSPAPYTPSVPVNPSNGTYAFENVTGLLAAVCAPDGARHTVTVWYEYRQQDETFDHFSKATCGFDVQCADLPNCNELIPPQALATLTASLPTLSYRYEVHTSSFAGPEVGFFNGLWHLKMGSFAPEQITFESPASNAGVQVGLLLSMSGHRLVFQLGKSSVTYLMTGCCGFHGSGESVFDRVECVGIGPDNSVPASVVLRAIS